MRMLIVALAFALAAGAADAKSCKDPSTGKFVKCPAAAAAPAAASAPAATASATNTAAKTLRVETFIASSIPIVDERLTLAERYSRTRRHILIYLQLRVSTRAAEQTQNGNGSPLSLETPSPRQLIAMRPECLALRFMTDGSPLTENPCFSYPLQDSSLGPLAWTHAQ